MDRAEVDVFVKHWLDAWNSHDVDGVVDHFTEDAVFTSPVAQQLIDGSGGVLRGKAAIRDYWSYGFERIPDLHFELEGVYVGVSTLVINYRNQRGGLVNEVLVFDGSMVVEGHGTYLDAGANPAGATDDG